MGIDKNSINKFATFFGYLVYVVTIIFGIYITLADPNELINSNPTKIQIAGVILICYGLVQVVVTFYNRLPPMKVKTAEQVNVDKARMREINDRKSKDKIR